MVSRPFRLVCVVALISMLGLAACVPAVPVTNPPEATTPPTEVPTQFVVVPGTEPPIGTQATTVRPNPGTILLDQTSNLSATQNAKVEMTFDVLAMQPVTVEATLAAGTPSYEFDLVDKYGNFLATFKSDPAKDAETIPEITLPYAGTYKIVLLPAAGDGSVAVRVTALGPPTGGGTLDVGGTLEALIGAARTYHTYQFPLTRGQSVTIGTKASDPGALDTSFVMYGPDGQYLTDADDINPPTNLDAQVHGFVAPMDGTYTAIVTTKGENTGSYTFSVALDAQLPEAQGAPDIVYGKEYFGNFTDKSNVDVTFDGTVTDVVKIATSQVSSKVSLDIYLISPFGQTLAFAVNTAKGSPTAINEVQLPYTGRYTVEVRPSGDGQAHFMVTHLTTAPTGGGMLSDEQPKLPGRVNAANVFHVYQFDAKAGDRVSLAAFSVSRGGTLDLGFALISPNGRQLLFADNSQSQFPNDPELTDYEIMQSGTYVVIIYSSTNATGTYDFVFTRK